MRLHHKRRTRLEKGLWMLTMILLMWSTVLGAQEVSVWNDATPQSVRTNILKRKFNGEWILYPNWETNSVPIPLGIVPIPETLDEWSWEGFVSSLSSTNWNGYTVFVTYVWMNDDTGAVNFYRENTPSQDGRILSVGGQNTGYNPWWVAEVFHQNTTGWQLTEVSQEDPRRAYLCSTQGYLLWFVEESDAEAFRVSLRPTPHPIPRRAPAVNNVTTNLHFESIIMGKSNIAFSASWWPSELPGGGLDLFCQTNLLQDSWDWVARYPVNPSSQEVEFELNETNSPPIWADLLFHGSNVVTGVTVTQNGPSLPEGFPPELQEEFVPNATIVTTNTMFTGASAAFFRLGTMLDSNTNGWTDAYEKMVSLTDPLDSDTDKDGFFNDWELERGLNPCSPDTDEDGFGDASELAMSLTISTNALERWLDTSEGINVTTMLSELDDGYMTYTLPFPIHFNGAKNSRFSATANGLLGLYSTDDTDIQTVSNIRTLEQQAMTGSCTLLVAAFWEDLEFFPDIHSSLWLADVSTNGHRYAVVEYRDVGFFSEGATTSHLVTFQIVFEEGATNRVSVLFSNAQGRGKGRDATLGARTRTQVLSYALPSTDSVFPGLALDYLFGMGTDPLCSDSDEDGVADGDEILHSTDPLCDDTDEDGLSDGEELEWGTDGTDPDTDGDGLGDWWETRHTPEFDPLDPTDGQSDADNDGLSFYLEYPVFNTNPISWDSDGDGLSDAYELLIHTDPNQWDSDDDGLSDPEEIQHNTDPNDADTDGDVIPDGWEVHHPPFDPLDDWDGLADWDGDGLTNVSEVHSFNTDPWVRDTDGDGISDGYEINPIFGLEETDPLNPDTDGDGLLDGEESLLETDPNDNDSDGDGYLDGWEVTYGYDPLDDEDPLGTDDPDGDGLSTSQEAHLGTDPTSDDTDDDGLIDSDEVCWLGQGLPVLDTSSATSLLSTLWDLDIGSVDVPLPFPIEFQSVMCSSIRIHVDGFVECIPSQNRSNAVNSLLRVEGFRDDLCANSELGSDLVLTEVETNEMHYCVIEFRNMAFYSEPNIQNMVSFQIVFCKEMTNFVSISFQKADGRGNGRFARLEVEGFQNELRYSSRTSCVFSGLSLGYHMGTGTNPLVSDTDGDGLTDSLEVALKLNPFSSDTDGDMLPDAWEMQHPGLNPKSSNSRTDDPDNDGLDTATEYVHGTDPFSSDTDGDNVSDGDEIAQGSNPLDESDHESAPSEDIVAVPFSLYGDYAAWDMNIQGLDDDTRAFTLTTLRPGRTETQTIPLRRGNAYRVTLSWRGSYPHINPYWYCWEAQMDGLPREPSFLDYHSYRLPGQNEIFGRTNVIVENTDGLFTSHIHTMDEEGGNIAQGRAAILHVLRASLVPDRNRDQVISIEDAETSSPLHVWINDDLDTGDISSKTSDIPGQTDQDTPNNSRDNRINGTSDLLDFFPVWVDASEAIEKIETLFGYSLYLTLRVRQEDSAVSWISTLLTTNTAGTYLTDTNFPYASAETRIASPEGSDCPPFFIEAIRNNPACGILLIEGRTESEKPLVVEIRYLDRVLCELSLPLQVHSVEERMEKVNLREGRAQLRSGWYEPPSNGAHVYFVHGFSIDEERNRGWNSEMYKRLWQSGCNARYHAIDWKGNEGLMDGSWHYQQNVANALGTAIDLKDYVNRQTGRKVVLAHSLGNMVVSRAISKYELEVDTYILLNAAVPVEAYDPTQFSTETNNVMVPLTWRGLTNLCWSAQYHSLFPEDDDRHDLTWKGYFANVPNLTTMINYHSGTNTEDGDEVLELFDEGPPSIFQGETISHYSWHKQEVNKGCGESANPASTDCAGWGMRDFGSTFANPNLYESTGIIWERVLEYMKRYPIFWPNPESILTNSIPMADHYTILAKGIPALSGPAGSRPFLEEPRVYNINMNLPNFKNGWPHTGDRYEDFLVRWLHSDIVAVSFLFTHPLFFDIMEKGNLK